MFINKPTHKTDKLTNQYYKKKNKRHTQNKNNAKKKQNRLITR